MGRDACPRPRKHPESVATLAHKCAHRVWKYSRQVYARFVKMPSGGHGATPDASLKRARGRHPHPHLLLEMAECRFRTSGGLSETLETQLLIWMRESDGKCQWRGRSEGGKLARRETCEKEENGEDEEGRGDKRWETDGNERKLFLKFQHERKDL